MNKQSEKDRPIIRAMSWDSTQMSREILLTREWVVTNGLGGYASGTISGAITRRYHGLLIAALPAPHGRMVMWSHVSEFLRFGPKDVVSLGGEERAGGQLDLQGADFLREFRLEDGLPVWTYHVRDLVLEKRIVLPHLQNTVHVNYRVLAGETQARLELRPAFHFRHHEASVDAGTAGPYKLTSVGDRYEIAAPRGRSLPPLRMKVCDCPSAFTISAKKIPQVVYRIEQSRGYAHEGDLWSPGFFHVDLDESDSATLVGSTEQWDIVEVFSPENALAAERERRARLLHSAVPKAQRNFPAELIFAADQFVITPAGRFEEAARAHAAGDEVRTVIAGYHWFTDWGRDTMFNLAHRSLARSWLHPANFRSLRSRRSDSKHVSRRRTGRRVSHGGCDALVFSRPRPIPPANKRFQHFEISFAVVDRHRRTSSAWHAFQHSYRSKRRSARARRIRLSTYLDGREDGRLGGYAAPRKSR